MKSKIKQYFLDDSTPDKSKRRQQLVVVATCLAIVLFCVGIFVLPGKDAKKMPFPTDGKTSGKIKISGVTSGAKAEDRWLEEAGNKLKEIDNLSKSNAKLEAEIAAMKKESADSKQAQLGDHKAVIDGYYDEITKLEKRIDEISGQKQLTAKPFSQNGLKGQFGAEKAASMLDGRIEENGANITGGVTGGGTMSLDFKLDDEEEEETNTNIFDTSEYLPAGSYVPAIVISGVDASVGISSQGDPRPVLFRVNGDAVSAVFNEEEQQKIDIKGCTVTGAASGDLSSEKVFVRLLKMTCSRESGTVIETDVHGYVTAVGKAGVRGPVVSREGDLVAKAFIAGLAGGVGNGVAQSLTTPATVVGGVATQTPNVRDIAGQGVGKGLQSSADRLSDYLIKRAEQYQPVITMSAGIEVELVFIDGVYLDGKNRASKKSEVKKNG